jgi:cell division protein FtsW
LTAKARPHPKGVFAAPKQRRKPPTLPSFHALLTEKATGRYDLVLLAAVVVLVLFGFLMVYSASYYAAERNLGDGFFYLKKQVLGGVLGGAALFACSRLHYGVWQKLRYVVLGASFVLLALVFIPGVGVESYGAKRWIDLPGFTIQASELAKFGFILFAASYMARYHERMRTFAGLLPVLGVGAAMAVLIILEPNMSITLCLLMVMMTMLFIGGARLKYFLLLLAPLAALVPVLILIEPYRLNRLTAFLNPWASPRGEGFQLIQSLYAIGSGGLFGTGLFNSRQKYLFLPFSESDFIFSVIAEEFGLFGALVTLLLFGVVIWRCVRIAIHAPDRLGCYTVSGIAAIVAVQTLVNVAVVTGSIPPTGLPLPFISAGSSSLVVFMAAIGIAENVARRSKT